MDVNGQHVSQRESETVDYPRQCNGGSGDLLRGLPIGTDHVGGDGGISNALELRSRGLDIYSSGRELILGVLIRYPGPIGDIETQLGGFESVGTCGWC